MPFVVDTNNFDPSNSTILELRAEALHDDFDPTTYSTQVDKWIVDALKDLSRKLKFPISETSATLDAVAGTAEIVLPEDLVALVGVYDTTAQSYLDEIGYEDRSTNSGTPSSYALYGENLILSPVPQTSGTYTLLYHQLLGAPDSGPIAVDLDEAIVAFVRSRLFKREDDFEMSRLWQEDYKTIVAEKRSELGGRGQRKRVIGTRRVRMFPAAYRP